MKAIREGRTIHLSNVESEHAPQFSICVMYTKAEGPAVLDKAIALDNIIMPLILRALNTEETAPTESSVWHCRDCGACGTEAEFSRLHGANRCPECNGLEVGEVPAESV